MKSAAPAPVRASARRVCFTMSLPMPNVKIRAWIAFLRVVLYERAVSSVVFEKWYLLIKSKLA